VEKIKYLLLDKYGDQPVTIRWAGGEPFISRAYLDLWEYISKSGKTNIRNVIQTNGSYIKKKADLLEKFLPYVDSIWVSFDAGTSDTYSKTRVNGNWDTLLENCSFLRKLIDQSGARTKMNSSFVTQLDNYEEIKQYCETANQVGFDGINVNNMWNWDTWSMEEFNRKNVFSPTHPEYNKLIKIITDVKSENYGNKVRPYNWKNI
jgi:sulfatase maturation enzyme AslB (radical SAM superfamily)